MGTDQDASFRWALAGYGAGGRTFHRPLISSATGLELVAVVTGSPERQAQVRAELPGATPVGGLADLAGLGVQGVTITTPTATHARAGARGAGPRPARRGGQTVRADRGGRPRAGRPRRRRRPGHHPVPEPPVGQRPADPAQADRRRRARRGAPVHLPDRPVPAGQGQLARRNRRARAAAPCSTSGRTWSTRHCTCSARSPRCTPNSGRSGTGAGAEDEIELHLTHAGGVRSTLAAGMASAAPGPRFQVNGRLGGFVIDGFDVQEEQLKAGGSPASLGD